MPLYQNKPVVLDAHDPNLDVDKLVWRVRFTGEIYESYEKYLEKIDFYNATNFQCSFSGKRGLTYEEAMTSELKTEEDVSKNIPMPLKKSILEKVQYSSKGLNELVTEIYDYLKDYCKDKNFKLPKKHLIRCQIRMAAYQEFNNSPWLLKNEYLTQYNIVKPIPSHVKELFDKYHEKQREKLEKKQRKVIKREKEKEKEKENENDKENESILSNVIDLTENDNIKKEEINKVETKHLKYPCDDHLLLIYNKHSQDNLKAFSEFFENTRKIVKDNGIENEENVINESNESNSNVVYYDFLLYLKEESRFGDNVFDGIWDIWTFVQVYSKELNMAAFPISYLIESLMYDKKCVLLEELITRLMEMIRSDCMIKFEKEKEKLIAKDSPMKKRGQKGKKGKKGEKRETTAKKYNTRSNTRKNYTELSEEDDDDEDEDDSNEESNDDSNEDEDDDDDSSGGSENDSQESQEQGSEEEQDNDKEKEKENNGNGNENGIEDVSEYDKVKFDASSMTHPVFDENEICDFKFHLLREYLLWRCKFDDSNDSNDSNDGETEKEKEKEKEKESKNGKAEIDDDNEENENSNNDKNENSGNDLEMKARNEENKSEFEFNQFDKFEFINKELIYDGLQSVRKYNSLDLESKLEIILLLLNDCMQGNSFNKYCKNQNREYRQVLLKLQKKLDDELQQLIKSEKSKQKDLRNEITLKKKELKNNENSNNDNNNNKNDSTNEKEEKERENIKKMEKQLKEMRDKMNEKIKLKEYENIQEYWKAKEFCQIRFEALGRDRYYNEYYWSPDTDGRILIYCSNNNDNMNEENEENDKEACMMSLRNLAITPTNSSMNLKSDRLKHIEIGDKAAHYELMDVLKMKGCDPWIVSAIMMNDSIESVNKMVPFWRVISTTKEFSQLLSVLDERGHREHKLVKRLNGLKDEIINCMRNEGNDNVTVFDEDESAQLYTLRRSRRAKHKSVNESNFRSYSAKLNIQHS